MSKKSNRINVPEAREAMDKFKMEAASEVGVNLKEGYNGDLTSRGAGSGGGQWDNKLSEPYEMGLYGGVGNGGPRRRAGPLLSILKKAASPLF